MHADDKPFVCQECGKSFKTKESLRLHLRIHNGDKPFKCNQCDAKFNNSSNLKKHVATHSSKYNCIFKGNDIILVIIFQRKNCICVISVVKDLN